MLENSTPTTSHTTSTPYLPNKGEQDRARIKEGILRELLNHGRTGAAIKMYAERRTSHLHHLRFRKAAAVVLSQGCRLVHVRTTKATLKMSGVSMVVSYIRLNVKFCMCRRTTCVVAHECWLHVAALHIVFSAPTTF